jgi:hypothetical protein
MIKLQLNHDQSSIFTLCIKLIKLQLFLNVIDYIIYIQIKKMKHDHKEKEQSKLELVVKALNVISK